MIIAAPQNSCGAAVVVSAGDVFFRHQKELRLVSCLHNDVAKLRIMETDTAIQHKGADQNLRGKPGICADFVPHSASLGKTVQIFKRDGAGCERLLIRARIRDVSGLSAGCKNQKFLSRAGGHEIRNFVDLAEICELDGARVIGKLIHEELPGSITMAKAALPAGF